MKDYQDFLAQISPDIPEIERDAIQTVRQQYPDLIALTDIVNKISSFMTLEILRRYHDWVGESSAPVDR